MRVLTALACMALLSQPAIARDDIDERPMSQRRVKGWTPSGRAPAWWSAYMSTTYHPMAYRRLAAHCLRATRDQRSELCVLTLKDGGIE